MTADTVFVLLLCCIIANVVSSGHLDGVDGVLSRRKRYVAFPDGASIAFALDMTHKIHTPDPFWTEGCSWAVGYQLPNATSYELFFQKKRKKFLMQRRQRRDLYERMEVVMDSIGYSGKDCIYRTLCETAKKYLPDGNSVVEELLRILFSFPQEKVHPDEPEEHKLYHFAYLSGTRKGQECHDVFPNCPFSLLNLILGGYNADTNDLN